MAAEPIRLWLWLCDGTPFAEIVLAPGTERPTVWTFGSPTMRVEFWQDPGNADMYRERAIRS
jgi:hypothetical protein